MKKIFTFIAVAAMALSFSACKKSVSNIDPSKLDDTTEKCWKVTYSGKAAGHSYSEDKYAWATERALVISLQKTEQYAGGSLKCSYQGASQYKDEESCYNANYKH